MFFLVLGEPFLGPVEPRLRVDLFPFSSRVFLKEKIRIVVDSNSPASLRSDSIRRIIRANTKYDTTPTDERTKNKKDIFFRGVLSTVVERKTCMKPK